MRVSGADNDGNSHVGLSVRVVLVDHGSSQNRLVLGLGTNQPGPPRRKRAVLLSVRAKC
jgi:hypothetical protein